MEEPQLHGGIRHATGHLIQEDPHPKAAHAAILMQLWRQRSHEETHDPWHEGIYSHAKVHLFCSISKPTYGTVHECVCGRQQAGTGGFYLLVQSGFFGGQEAQVSLASQGEPIRHLVQHLRPVHEIASWSGMPTQAVGNDDTCVHAQRRAFDCVINTHIYTHPYTRSLTHSHTHIYI